MDLDKTEYIYEPKNFQIENEDIVLRTFIKKYHYPDNTINHEIFLLRKLKDKKGIERDEDAISVIVSKLMNNPESQLEALDYVPNKFDKSERGVFILKADDLRNLLIGVTHTPSTKITQHGSLHGHFCIQKAIDISGIAEAIYN